MGSDLYQQITNIDGLRPKKHESWESGLWHSVLPFFHLKLIKAVVLFFFFLLSLSLHRSHTDIVLVYSLSKQGDQTWATHTHLAPRAQGVAVHTQTHIWYQSKQSSVYIWKWTQSDLTDQFRCPLRVRRHTVPLTSVHLKADGWHIRAARLSVFYKRVFKGVCVPKERAEREHVSGGFLEAELSEEKATKRELTGAFIHTEICLEKLIQLKLNMKIHDQDCKFSSLFLSFSSHLPCGKACYVGFSPDHVHFLGV